LLTTFLSEWVDETGMCTCPFTADRQIVIMFPTSPAISQAPQLADLIVAKAA
jgi:hypothetical protein